MRASGPHGQKRVRPAEPDAENPHFEALILPRSGVTARDTVLEFGSRLRPDGPNQAFSCCRLWDLRSGRLTKPSGSHRGSGGWLMSFLLEPQYMYGDQAW